ncbi:MAG: amidase [Polyangiales bacterium]
MNDLCSKSATELSGLLQKKEVTSVELVRAHLDRIDRIDGKLRAFTRVFRDEALAEARASDEARQQGKTLGPLHGLPMSVKESIDMAGLAATMGVPSRRSVIAKGDGGMVQMLREAGAIILGRTNVSQYLIFHESRNPIFGQTANPWSLAHTPGGSSGGEGTAIAAGLSPAGVGTDIGGSIRVPAAWTGIAGLKPTLDRWTNKGSNTSLAGQEAVRGQIGPMARTVDDLIMLMRALDPIRMSEIDPRVPPLPFRDPASIDVKRLRVGWYVDDGFVSPSLAVSRAVERTVDVLRDHGCTVRPFMPPGMTDAVLGYFGALSSDGGAILARGLEGGAIDPVLEGLRRVARLRPAIRSALVRVLELVGEDKVAKLLRVTHAKPVDAFWGITNELRAYRFTVLDAMRAAGVDLLVCPTHATPALPHGFAKDFPVAGSPSMLFNVLQFPAGVVPITRVRANETHRISPRGRLERHAAKVDETTLGLPLGVQIVARPWQDEEVLAAMRVVERGVAHDEGFPRTPVELP